MDTKESAIKMIGGGTLMSGSATVLKASGDWVAHEAEKNCLENIGLVPNPEWVCAPGTGTNAGYISKLESPFLGPVEASGCLGIIVGWFLFKNGLETLFRRR